MARERISVALVDDDPAVRQRFKASIEKHPDLLWLGEATCVREGKALALSTSPRVLLVDLGLPDGSGMEIIQAVSQKQPNTEIMVVSMFGDEGHVVQAIEAGASGYILKDTDDLGLERRIQQAGLELEWKVDDLPDFPNMTPQDALNLQRIVQETLVNAVKHAKASKVSLIARMKAPNCLKIQVKDNGCGFDDQQDGFTGRGLSNLHYRAVELNASLTINTQLGRGCCVELQVPISKTS